MPKITWLSFLLIFFFIITCQSPKNDDASAKAIEILILNYTNAFDAKDFQKFSSFCHDDFRFFTLDGQVFDKKGTAEFLTKILEEWEEIHSEIGNLEIQVDQTLAFARYTVVYHHIIDGVPGTMTVRISAVFKKNADKWQLYHFHMSRRYV